MDFPPRMTDAAPVSWSELCPLPEEADPERVKNVVSPKDYEELEVGPSKKFFFRKNMTPDERTKYRDLVISYSDVFAWSPTDLRVFQQR